MEVGRMYIDGEWVLSSNGKTRDIINPYDNTVFAKVADGTLEDTRRAVAAAKRAFYEDGFGETSAKERAALMLKLADLMEENVSEIAKAETLNTGKALIESEYDVYDSVDCIRYYAGIINKPTGQTYSVSDPNVHSMTVREPIGVCGLIVAWNFPISLAVWKLAPALAAGNTVVMKPASITPLSAIKIFELIEKAGFPKGTANLVLGSGATVGNELAQSSDIDKVAFTGGKIAGQEIMKAASGNMKGISLELGGKSPNVIFADADFDAAVDYGLFGIFYNQGEVCSAASRLIVEDKIYDKYVEKLVEKANKIKIGNGMDKDVRMGPLVSKEHFNDVLNYIEIGKNEGAKLVCGGKKPEGKEYEKGFFIEPTIFTNVTSDMRIVKEEIFGPVLVIQRFSTEEEAVKLANDTDYGLAAGVFSNDISKALRVIKKIRAGITWINTYGPVYNEAPWGGYKQSGIGRELGTYGLDDYTEVKQININLKVEPTMWFE